jgi:fimbrial chaperone protein
MIGITMLAVASMAAASSFSLSPLGLSIRANEASGAVTARNQGSETIVIQVRAFTWSQDAEGAEKRTETQDLIINPAVFRIGPGEEQFVRIGPKGSRARDAERAYRLVFSEVLPTLPPGAQSALRMSLAMDVPLYEP